MFKSEKPVTAITVLIERLTREEYDVDDLSDLPTLIEAIRLQSSTGPTEAARAIRKKLKYGNPHRQLRALVILDDLIQNAGTGFQRRFADEPLLERLRLMVTEPMTDAEVKEKCNSLYRQWAAAYKSTQGMQEVAALYKQLPQRKRNRPRQDDPSHRQAQMAEDPFGTEDGSQRERSGSLRNQMSSPQASAPSPFASPSAGSFSTSISAQPPKKDRRPSKDKVKPFKFEKERTQITHVLTMSNIEATGLLNALKLLDREKERVSSNPAIRQRYDTCKTLHRQTLRYCSLVTDENYLGALLQANDQVAEATRLYEQLDRSFDYDSDSEGYDAPAGGAAKGKAPLSPTVPISPITPSARQRMASLSLAEAPSPNLPTRPAANPTFTFNHAEDGKGKAKKDAPPSEGEDEDEEDDDPFADRNAVHTPRAERGGFSF